MAEPSYVVVDGSNLATEGRTEPSLAQLDEAVRTFAEEHPEAEIIVVVDATFAHRIGPEEREQLEQAHLHGELVWPPAGTVGRGDAFVLRIAERIGGVVLSNDSFQEFQEEHPWLFEAGRLVGGKPVPGVGWIFAQRVPVRPSRKPAPPKRVPSIAKGPPKKPPGGYKIGATKRAAPTITAAAAMELALAPAEQPAPAKKSRSKAAGKPPAEQAEPAKKATRKKAGEAKKAETAEQPAATKKARAKKEAPAEQAEPPKKATQEEGGRGQEGRDGQEGRVGQEVPGQEGGPGRAGRTPRRRPAGRRPRRPRSPPPKPQGRARPRP